VRQKTAAWQLIASPTGGKGAKDGTRFCCLSSPPNKAGRQQCRERKESAPQRAPGSTVGVGGQMVHSGGEWPGVRQQPLRARAHPPALAPPPTLRAFPRPPPPLPSDIALPSPPPPSARLQVRDRVCLCQVRPPQRHRGRQRVGHTDDHQRRGRGQGLHADGGRQLFPLRRGLLRLLQGHLWSYGICGALHSTPPLRSTHTHTKQKGISQEGR
jgi:hypothetical protein